MTVIGAIRGGGVNFPLFLHVLGAMLLVGTLIAVVTALALSWSRRWTAAGLTRLGLRVLPMGVVPAYVLMRIGAQWTESKENLPEQVEESTWLGIGYLTADAGAIVILVAVILAVIGLRNLRSGGGSGLAAASGILSSLLLAAYLVTVWAMTTKPD